MVELAVRVRPAPALQSYFVADEEDPLGLLLDAAEPPLMPPLLLDAAPASVEDDAAPPLPALLVPPVAPVVPLVDEAELESPGAGAVVVDDDDEPPGTMTVSFSFVTDEVGPGLLPGTTVVVVSFSQPARARAPTSTNR